MVKFSIIIAVILIIAVGQLVNSTDTHVINTIDGLLVPTQEEARLMVPPARVVIESFEDLPVPGGRTYDIRPLNFDIYLAEEKGLAVDREFTREYLYMQALYRKALEQYLAKRLNLARFDELLARNRLAISPVSEDDMCFHQRYSTFGFSFIYLRNNLPIERLSLEDIDILRRYINAESFDITEELLELAARTFQHIILFNGDREPDSLVSSYLAIPLTMPNNALVLVIDYDHDDNSSWDEMHIYLVEEFIPMMEKELSEKLCIPVFVLRDPV